MKRSKYASRTKMFTRSTFSSNVEKRNCANRFLPGLPGYANEVGSPLFSMKCCHQAQKKQHRCGSWFDPLSDLHQPSVEELWNLRDSSTFPTTEKLIDLPLNLSLARDVISLKVSIHSLWRWSLPADTCEDHFNSTYSESTEYTVDYYIIVWILYSNAHKNYWVSELSNWLRSINTSLTSINIKLMKININ